MNLVHLLILAVIQGIAEFLPISSSGHVVVAAALLGQDLEIADVNIVLHLGTLVSILIFYWQRVWRLLTSDKRVIPLLIVGTIPAGVLGIIIKKQFKWLLEEPLLAGCLLIVTGLLLLLPKRFKQQQGTYQELSLGKAFAIGCAQAFALLPGISRSGTTIVAGLGNGLSRQDAATFSFLLAVPAIAGASVLEIADMLKGETELTTPILHLGVGALVACCVGLASLSWLIRWLETGRLQLFSFWCITLGIGVAIWQLV